MITASEVRVGNIVNYNYKPVKINAIREDGGLNVKYENTLLGAEFECFDPIELTTEILDKSNFRPLILGTTVKREFGGMYLRVTLNKGITYGKGRKVSTVHQLQNLYYALTGKELEIKL